MDVETTNGSGAGRMQAAAGAVGESAAGMSREFKNFIADVEDLIRTSTSLSSDEFARLKQRIAERANAAKEALRPAGESIVGRARRAMDVTHEYVNDEPWKAVGIGAVLGFFMGMLVARR